MPKYKRIQHERVISDCSAQKPLTQQHFAQDCNINNIMERALRTGRLPESQERASKAFYGDVTSIDFRMIQEVITDATSAFMELPANIRKRFRNDPAELLEFTEDPQNYEEAISLGIISRPHQSDQGVTPQEKQNPAGKPDEKAPLNT
ncbi:MAG: internal scaffolding protein [Arizlama microvirus]|nr:MAG: internal scaffolding protein [Arizlama microvirus]